MKDPFETYHEHILNYLSSLLSLPRYSPLAFELITSLLSQLFRCGYVCSLVDEKNLMWRVTK